MTKLEKVIKGLECCKEGYCPACPYYDEQSDEGCDMFDDALELLKEQLVRNPDKSGWVSVKDRLPTQIGQDCWVWGDGWEHEGREPDMDWWEGRRGEKVTTKDGETFISSGFYHNDMEQITHWMAIEKPEQPKEEKEC